MKLSNIFGFVLCAAVIGILAAPSARARDAKKTAKKTEAPKVDENKQTLDAMKAAVKNKVDKETKEALKKLESDLKEIRAKVKTEDADVKKLQDDIVAVIRGTVAPSKDSVEKFAKDLAPLAINGRPAYKAIAAIQEDLFALLNSANITDQQLAAVKADIESILTEAQVTPKDIQTLLADLQAICASAKENAGKK